VLAGGVTRLARANDERRGGIAAATAAAAVFALAAGFDWMWEIAVLAVVFLVLAAVALTARDREEPAGDAPGGAGRPVLRVASGVIAVLALAVIAIPLGTATAVRESQAAAGSGDIERSLSTAEDAKALQPYAASPDLQRALVLEQAGRLPEAVAAARAASENEPQNWRTWLILARVEAEAGNAQQAVDAYREARRLNPRSGLFAR
jgi:tetratricopeptide (TPR) repeat protein